MNEILNVKIDFIKSKNEIKKELINSNVEEIYITPVDIRPTYDTHHTLYDSLHHIYL